MRTCGLEVGEKKTIALMAEDNPKATTTLIGCYYFYENDRDVRHGGRPRAPRVRSKRPRRSSRSNGCRLAPPWTENGNGG